MARFAAALSLLVGFLSLSQEILWVRLVSFAQQGSAYAFPLVLMLFLLGIAMGAATGKRWCAADADLTLRAGRALLGAAVVDAGTLWLLLAFGQTLLALPIMLSAVIVSAALKATVFPIAHHLGSRPGATLGRSVSRIYFANIIGSTGGPIVTGYVLLDLFALQTCLAAVALGSAALGAACLWRSGHRHAWRWSAPPAVLAMACLVVPSHLLVSSLALGGPVGTVLENRHGIVHTVAEAGQPEKIYGNNVYDGVSSVDLVTNSNLLDRALVLLVTHPRPDRVLVIGLSGGAWTRILSASPHIRELVVVEINPAYLDLVRQSPATAALLQDPRVRVVIDDGRRWMRQHQGEGFDLIVQNTTYHWRAYTNNLLSREYLGLAKGLLRPGGILTLNSTYSSDVLATMESVFPHVERRRNFIYGSDRAFATPLADARSRLEALQLEGRPVFAPTAFDAHGVAASLLAEPFVAAERRAEDLNFRGAVITDRNLLAEHAHGNATLHEQLSGLADWVEKVRAVTAPAP